MPLVEGTSEGDSAAIYFRIPHLTAVLLAEDDVKDVLTMSPTSTETEGISIQPLAEKAFHPKEQVAMFSHANIKFTRAIWLSNQTAQAGNFRALCTLRRATHYA